MELRTVRIVRFPFRQQVSQFGGSYGFGFLCRVESGVGADYGARRRQRTPRPPNVQRGNMPMPDGFLPPRIAEMRLMGRSTSMRRLGY